MVGSGMSIRIDVKRFFYFKKKVRMISMRYEIRYTAVRCVCGLYPLILSSCARLDGEIKKIIYRGGNQKPKCRQIQFKLTVDNILEALSRKCKILIFCWNISYWHWPVCLSTKTQINKLLNFANPYTVVYAIYTFFSIKSKRISELDPSAIIRRKYIRLAEVHRQWIFICVNFYDST